MKYFVDTFKISHCAQGYTLNVSISRPANAPRYKHTKADRERLILSNDINLEIGGYYFRDFEEIRRYIKMVNNLGTFKLSDHIRYNKK